MPRLYKADLLGAAAGVVVVLWLMHSVGTPLAAMLCALPMLAASMIASRGIMRVLPAILAVGILLLCPWADRLLQAPREERAPVIYTHWDAMAKVKVYDYGGQYRGINIDNVANSPVYAFDGNFADPELSKSEWGIDVSYLIGLFDNCRFLSLGAGGGSDVLQALVEGATEVTAVEVNPHINHMMIQMYALFIGASIYSITTVLLTLLFASGLGSGLCERLSNKVIFSSIVALILLHAFVFGHLTGILTSLDQMGRVIVTALLVFPLGFFMGMPFPKGALKVGPLVDWGFAVNGAASVLGATAIMLVAFASGFAAALTVGAILYALAYVVLCFERAW